MLIHLNLISGHYHRHSSHTLCSSSSQRGSRGAALCRSSSSLPQHNNVRHGIDVGSTRNRRGNHRQGQEQRRAGVDEGLRPEELRAAGVCRSKDMHAQPQQSQRTSRNEQQPQTLQSQQRAHHLNAEATLAVLERAFTYPYSRQV